MAATLADIARVFPTISRTPIPVPAGDPLAPQKKDINTAADQAVTDVNNATQNLYKTEYGLIGQTQQQAQQLQHQIQADTMGRLRAYQQALNPIEHDLQAQGFTASPIQQQGALDQQALQDSANQQSILGNRLAQVGVQDLQDRVAQGAQNATNASNMIAGNAQSALDQLQQALAAARSGGGGGGGGGGRRYSSGGSSSSGSSPYTLLSHGNTLAKVLGLSGGTENPLNGLVRQYANEVNGRYLQGLEVRIANGENPMAVYNDVIPQLYKNRKHGGASGVGAITPIKDFLNAAAKQAAKPRANPGLSPEQLYALGSLFQ